MLSFKERLRVVNRVTNALRRLDPEDQGPVLSMIGTLDLPDARQPARGVSTGARTRTRAGRLADGLVAREV